MHILKIISIFFISILYSSYASIIPLEVDHTITYDPTGAPNSPMDLPTRSQHSDTNSSIPIESSAASNRNSPEVNFNVPPFSPEITPVISLGPSPEDRSSGSDEDHNPFKGNKLQMSCVYCNKNIDNALSAKHRLSCKHPIHTECFMQIRNCPICSSTNRNRTESSLRIEKVATNKTNTDNLVLPTIALFLSVSYLITCQLKKNEKKENEKNNPNTSLNTTQVST